MERVAECHCGALKAIATGEPDRVYVCHCKACQRRTGAVIHNGTRWQKSQVRIEGEHKAYARKGDSGFEIRFHFCPNCGSSVFWEGDRAPDVLRDCRRRLCRPAFPGADRVDLGGGEAPLARGDNRNRALPPRRSRRRLRGADHERARRQPLRDRGSTRTRPISCR